MTKLVHQQSFRGAVLVARNGAVLLRKGYDMADVSDHRPNVAGTEFRIASITKQFTAMAIMLLQQSGKLRVRDRICRYIAPCPAAWRLITIRQLLTHTSGIPDFTSLPEYQAAEGSPIALRALIDLFRNQPLNFAPGTQWSYSRSGFVLLGRIIEVVSGESYKAFMRRRVFAPLELLHTGYDKDLARLPPRATGYQDWLQPADTVDSSALFAESDLISTVDDLYRWDQALVAHRLLSATATAMMFTPYARICPCDPINVNINYGHFKRIDYGYGWFLATYPAGQQAIFHIGAIQGVKSMNSMEPESRTTVIVLSNLGSFDLNTIQTLFTLARGSSV